MKTRTLSPEQRAKAEALWAHYDRLVMIGGVERLRVRDELEELFYNLGVESGPEPERAHATDRSDTKAARAEIIKFLREAQKHADALAVEAARLPVRGIPIGRLAVDAKELITVMIARAEQRARPGVI